MMTLIYLKLCNFIKDKRAIALPVFAGIAFTAITLTTTAIDVNYYVQAKRTLQDIADKAVLVGVTKGTTESEQMTLCTESFQQSVANNPNLKDIHVSHNIECKIVKRHIVNVGTEVVGTGKKSTLRIKGTVKIKTLFASNLGLGEFRVNIFSSASRDRNNTEVIFALSQQGTMCAETTDTDNDGLIEIADDPDCKKFVQTVKGIKDSIKEIKERLASNFVSIGVVPYTYKVSLPDKLNIPSSLTNLEDEIDFFEDTSDQISLEEIVPLKKDLDETSLFPDTSFGGKILPRGSPLGEDAWGRSDLAIHTAALMLDETQKQFFNNHDVKAWDDARKYVVLMADGANIGCCYTNQPSGNYDNQYTYHYIPYNEHMLHICEELKKQNVHIFTVFLNPGATNDASSQMNNVMARCASGQYADPDEEAAAELDSAILLTCAKKDLCYDIKDLDKIENTYSDIVSIITKPVIDF